jgi:hypothetical protein
LLLLLCRLPWLRDYLQKRRVWFLKLCRLGDNKTTHLYKTIFDFHITSILQADSAKRIIGQGAQQISLSIDNVILIRISKVVAPSAT